MASRLKVKLVYVLAAASTTATASAAEYPTRPIRLVVPMTAGSAADIVGRLVASELSAQMRQQVIVDNRGGANGILGYDLVAKAAPDGHTLGLANFPFITNPILFPALPYDSTKDFLPVVQTGFAAHVMTVTPLLPVRSVGQLIDHARAHPGKLSYAGGGAGGGPTLSVELLKVMTRTQIMQVPYKNPQQAIIDTMAGQVHIVCDNALSIGPHVRAERVRAIGVTTLQRLATFPDVPTISEAGVPGFEVAVSSGYIVPAGTPRDIVMRLNTEINKALKSSALSDRFATDGYVVAGGTPEQFREHLRRETVKWSNVIKASGIKPQ
jgi:tripartite-type tricarboxylate transporter receptor subunit TctC